MASVASANARSSRRSDRPEIRAAQARNERVDPLLRSDQDTTEGHQGCMSPMGSERRRRFGRLAQHARGGLVRRYCDRERRVPSVPVVLLARASQSARRIRAGEVWVEVAVSVGNVALPPVDELEDVTHAAGRAPAGRLVVDQLGCGLVHACAVPSRGAEAVVDIVQVDPERFVEPAEDIEDVPPGRQAGAGHC